MAMLNIEASLEDSGNSVNFSRESVCHLAEIPIKGVIALIASLICLGRWYFTVMDLWKCNQRLFMAF